jgi:hypothetical protein
MRIQSNAAAADLGRGIRRIGPSYFATPAAVIDSGGRAVATFRSPRKLGKAIVTATLVLLAGDTSTVGNRMVVS